MKTLPLLLLVACGAESNPFVGDWSLLADYAPRTEGDGCAENASWVEGPHSLTMEIRALADSDTDVSVRIFDPESVLYELQGEVIEESLHASVQGTVVYTSTQETIELLVTLHLDEEDRLVGEFGYTVDSEAGVCDFRWEAEAWRRSSGGRS